MTNFEVSDKEGGVKVSPFGDGVSIDVWRIKDRMHDDPSWRTISSHLQVQGQSRYLTHDEAIMLRDFLNEKLEEK